MRLIWHDLVLANPHWRSRLDLDVDLDRYTYIYRLTSRWFSSVASPFSTACQPVLSFSHFINKEDPHIGPQVSEYFDVNVIKFMGISVFALWQSGKFFQNTYRRYEINKTSTREVRNGKSEIFLSQSSHSNISIEILTW